METSQSETSTHNPQDYGGKDSITATASIEERQRCLEDAHSIHTPAHAESPLWSASLLHTQQISDLGMEYNRLEEAIYALEQANNDREKRVRKLEQQICALESKGTNGKDDLKSNEGEQQPTNAKTDPAASTFLVELDAQKTMLNDVAIRLRELEKSSARSLSAFTIHEVARSLTQRLVDGDHIEPMVHLQLRTALGARDISPLTPAPTSTTRGESRANAAKFDEPRPQRPPGRPRKRKVDGPVEEEPLSKRLRRRTTKGNSSDS